MPLQPAVAERVRSTECHATRIQERLKSSGCAHLPIKRGSKMDLTDVPSCISLDPYCFKDLEAGFFVLFFFFPSVVPSGLIFLSLLVFP